MPFVFDQTSAGSTGSVVQGLLTSSFALSAGTLAGGMRLVTATGSLPARLTYAADFIYTASLSTRSGICTDIDNLHFWTSDAASNQMERRLISNGNIDAVVTGSTTDPTRLTTAPESLTQQPGTDGRMWFAVPSLHLVGFVNPNVSPPGCELFSGTLSNPYHVIEHTPGKVLVRTGNNTSGIYIEYAYNGSGSGNTIAYTGKQTASGMFEAVSDGSGSVYTLAGSAIQKRAVATLTASTTLTTIGTLYQNIPGYGNAWRNFSYHPLANKLYVSQVNATDGGVWFSVDMSTMTVQERVFGGVELGSPVQGASSTVWFRQGIGYTPDGTKVIFATPPQSAVAATFLTTRMTTLAEQRARWTFVASTAATIAQVVAPGSLGNTNGFANNVSPTDDSMQQEYDHRRTRFYYSLDGGTTRVEFNPNTSLNLSVTASSNVTFDVIMQKKPNNMSTVDPWLGDTAGNGLVVFYTPS